MGALHNLPAWRDHRVVRQSGDSVALRRILIHYSGHNAALDAVFVRKVTGLLSRAVHANEHELAAIAIALGQLIQLLGSFWARLAPGRKEVDDHGLPRLPQSQQSRLGGLLARCRNLQLHVGCHLTSQGSGHGVRTDFGRQRQNYAV